MKKLNSYLLLFGGLSTILFSGCEERLSQIRSEKFEGIVVSEQRSEKEYKITLSDHNLDSFIYGTTLDIIFQDKYFDLEKLDNEYNLGMTLRGYGTEASRKRRDNDFIAHKIFEVELREIKDFYKQKK